MVLMRYFCDREVVLGPNTTILVDFLLGGGRGYDSSHFGWDQTHGKFIWHYLAISKATAGEKHPQSGSQGACGSKNDPEATPEYKKMEKNSEKTAFFTFWPLWAK